MFAKILTAALLVLSVFSASAEEYTFTSTPVEAMEVRDGEPLPVVCEVIQKNEIKNEFDCLRETALLIDMARQNGSQSAASNTVSLLNIVEIKMNLLSMKIRLESEDANPLLIKGVEILRERALDVEYFLIQEYERLREGLIPNNR